MDQAPKQKQGNFKMNLNFRHQSNPDDAPITGKISAPEAPDTAFLFKAWEKTDKNGEPYFIGPVEHHRSMRQALNATTLNGTHFIAIRESTFKVFKETRDGNPNPAYAALSAEEQAHEDSKPAYWATWTRGEGEPQLRASAWEREPNEFGPWASGNTQYPMTKEQVAAMKAGVPDAAGLNAPDPTPAPRRRAKADDHGRA